MKLSFSSGSSLHYPKVYSNQSQIPKKMDTLKSDSSEYDFIANSSYLKQKTPSDTFGIHFLTSTPLDVIGEILNTNENKQMLSLGDQVELKINKNFEVQVNNLYSVIRKKRNINSSWQYQTVGKIRIKQVEKAIIGEIENASSEINRDDLITSLIDLEKQPDLSLIASSNLNSKIIYINNEEGFVFFDKGFNHGIRIGQFYTKETQDPLINEKSKIKNTNDLRVVWVTDSYATAVSRGSLSDFSEGDLLRGSGVQVVSHKKENSITKKQIPTSEYQGIPKEQIYTKVDKKKYLKKRNHNIKKDTLADHYLDDQELNKIEKITQKKHQKHDSKESIEDIEKKMGKLYIDENIHIPDNPYGLTKYDVEEAEELINSI